MNPHYIADKSALARMRFASVSDVLSPIILAGDMATCGVIELEILYSTRSYADLAETKRTRALAFERIDIVQADFDRAIEVMMELAQRGLHRAVGIPDLLLAALAERAQLIIIHYDADFDHVSDITGQPMQWVVPRGSVV